MFKFCFYVHRSLTRLPLLSRNDRGVTSVEYALLVGLIALGIVVAVTGLAGNISGAFQKAGPVVNPAP
jgi:Flp pilus assembly pilin Flp